MTRAKSIALQLKPMRCEEKVAGGKLVCIELFGDEGRVARARITGDFFLHPEERITGLEESLVGLPLDAPEGVVAARLRSALGGAQMIGVAPEDLARMFRRAVG